MGAQTGVGLALALASTTLTSLGYLREHGAAAALPCLSLRRPAQSASGAALVVVGLVAPATSLAGGIREGGGGSTTAALIRLGATGAPALVVLSPGQSTLGPASAAGVAGEARDRARRPVRVCRGTHPRLCTWDRRAPGRLIRAGEPSPSPGWHPCSPTPCPSSPRQPC